MALALVFALAVGLVLTALASLAATNLVTTVSLQDARSLEFAANAGVEGAIQALRHQAPDSLTNPTCPTFPASPASSLTINGITVVVQCTMSIPEGFYGRLVEFDACVTPGSTFAACQAAAVVRSQVLFNDVATGCTTGASGPPCYDASGAWGTGMTIESWVVQTANG